MINNETVLIWSFSSVQFSRSVVSDSLQLHESQHTRPPCPSPAPRVDQNSCPLSRWCHPAISSSVVPFSSCPQSLPASGSFQMSQFFASGGQSTGVSALASFLPKNTQGWSPLEWTGWISLQSSCLLLLPSIFPSIRVFSNESVLGIRRPKYWSFSFSINPSNEHTGLISFRIDWIDLFAFQGTLKNLLQHHSSKASILWHSTFFRVQLSQSIHDYWKNHSFDYLDLCWQSYVSAF